MTFHRRIDQNTLLTAVEVSDADEIFTLVDESRMYLREWLPWVDASVSVDDIEEFIEQARKQDATGGGLQCAIRFRERLIGIAGLHRLDPFHKCVHLGYWIAAKHQGQGIVTRCCRTLIDYAFRELELHRVEIRAAVENLKSRGIPERLGFTREGTQRESEWVNDHYVNSVVYSILQDEWPG